MSFALSGTANAQGCNIKGLMRNFELSKKLLKNLEDATDKLKKQLQLRPGEENYSSTYANEKFGSEANKNELEIFAGNQQNYITKLKNKYAYAIAKNPNCYACGVITQYERLKIIGNKCDAVVKAYAEYMDTENPNQFYCDKLQKDGVLQVTRIDFENDNLSKTYWDLVLEDLNRLQRDITAKYDKGIDVGIDRLSDEITGLRFFAKQRSGNLKEIADLRTAIDSKPDCEAMPPPLK